MSILSRKWIKKFSHLRFSFLYWWENYIAYIAWRNYSTLIVIQCDRIRSSLFFSPFSFCFFDRSKFDTIPISFCRHWRLKHARIFRILVIQMPFIMLTITRELTCHQCEHRMYYWPVTTLDCFVSSYKKQKKRERERDRKNEWTSE